MNKETSFSFDSVEQKAEFTAYAKSKGMTLSAFVKWAVFAIRNKNRAGGHPHAKRAERTPALRE